MLIQRYNERYQRYVKADEQIAKCNDYIELDINAEQYAEYKTDLIEYKMEVRDSVNQDEYPDEVEYPKFPELTGMMRDIEDEELM